METDFRDAAERHWEDARYLVADARLANADQLFGLTAECALKSIMLGLGMKMHPKNPNRPEDPYAVHINKLWDQFVTFAHNRDGMHYSRSMVVDNPFVDWDVNQRYSNRGKISKETVDKHRDGAELVRGVLEGAILDGVVV